MSTITPTILLPVVGEGNLFVAGTAGILAAAAAYYYFLSPKDAKGEFPKLRGVQFYHAWNFFQRQFDFLQFNHAQNAGKSFSFNLLRHRVIALIGEDARQAFFSDPRLSLSEGFKVLGGTAPRARDADPAAGKTEELHATFMNKKLNVLFSKDRLQNIISPLLQDIIDSVEKMGNDGRRCRIDPFIEVNSMVFIMSARVFVCDDLTKNNADLKRIEGLYGAIEDTVTPASRLLPWFVGSAGNRRKEATTSLFTLIRSYVEKRRNVLPTSDPIDVLIADGETNEAIVTFIVRAYFAGISNTGMVTSWTLLYLGAHPEWKEKCREEVQNLVSHHVGTSTSSMTLHKRLSAIPLSAWEDDLPVLEACTREALRILFAGGITFRRNIDKYYPDPRKYDPGRWLRPDPVPEVAYPFLGWGVGRHVCKGMRVAKLEMKLLLAAFLMKYEYELVDQDGKFPNRVPFPNYNKGGPMRRRPTGLEYYLDDLKEIVH